MYHMDTGALCVVVRYQLFGFECENVLRVRYAPSV